ncbi:hypothetical protein C8P66_11951 [Humitalea rosea]|uniref:Uncharacterized protein n=1 Tax=Humitalea rosea TaxID=990373 RepID=A0A2W7I7C0_9PROT|nr:hypothetical protein [Humitalea rosea]PZW42159.1 hypothetical protein C8P66_11951 [Humitalea rosea]
MIGKLILTQLVLAKTAMAGAFALGALAGTAGALGAMALCRAAEAKRNAPAHPPAGLAQASDPGP